MQKKKLEGTSWLALELTTDEGGKKKKLTRKGDLGGEKKVT